MQKLDDGGTARAGAEYGGAVPTIFIGGRFNLFHRKAKVALLVVLLMFGVFGGAGGAAAAVKIAVVDVDRILNESLAGAEADETLQAFVAERQRVVDELEEELEELSAQLEAAEDGEARGELEERFEEKLAAFRRQLEAFEDEIADVVEDFRGQLLGDIRFVLGLFGEEHGYDLILDAGMVGYFSDALDVTDAVIEKYDELLLESRDMQN